MVVTLDGQPKLLFAKLGNVLADGEGHMVAFDWKGAAAVKQCLRHFNVYKKARSYICDDTVWQHIAYIFVTSACGLFQSGGPAAIRAKIPHGFVSS